MKLKIKKDIDIGQANALLHSFAAVLDEDSKERFYSIMQHVRTSGNPDKIVENVVSWIYIKAPELFVDEKLYEDYKKGLKNDN